MLAVIRVRGTLDVNPKIRTTLDLLMLHKANHLVLVSDSKALRGMLEAAKDYITFGKISEGTLARLLEKKGMLSGNKKISKVFFQGQKVRGFDELAKQVFANKKKLKDFGIKPVFRLNPPKKGFERGGIKKSFAIGGALGNRSEHINDLIERMIR